MKPYKPLIATVLCAFLCGCVGQMTFSTDDGRPVSERQFAADQSYCNAQAQAATGLTQGLMGVAILMQQKQICMRGKGYICSKGC